MWDCTLGGTAPNSPSIISLLVLILTFRIHFKYQRNTLSISWFALDDTPHTSLPYNSIGFVNVSKIYIVNLGGRNPIFLNFFNIRNMAFRALSQRNFELSLKTSPEHMFTGRMIFPRYLYESAFWIATPLQVITFSSLLPNTITLVF